MKRYNPFKPSFGVVPSKIVGRDDMIFRYINSLNNPPGDPFRTTIFTGTRGMGKTVILNAIADEACANGWIAVNASLNSELLDNIIDEILRLSYNVVGEGSKTRISGLTAAGFGINFTKDLADTSFNSWRGKMTAILEKLQAENIGLLLCIDEVHGGSKELQILVSAYQLLVSAGYNIALAMAGLPQSVSDLLNDKVITFLRRAHREKLLAVSIEDVKVVFRNTIEENGRRIDAQALIDAANATDGYPFLIQAVGYFSWLQNENENTITKDDVNNGIESAKIQMESAVLETALADISDKDCEFINAMAKDEGPSKIADVMERMKVDSNYAGTYRRRLIIEGIIKPAGYGKIDFAIPYLREYLRKDLEER
jgi:chromosomal replication initiation ATPase DnaA